MNKQTISADLACIQICLQAITHCARDIFDEERATGHQIIRQGLKVELNRLKDFTKNAVNTLANEIDKAAKNTPRADFLRRTNISAGVLLDLLFAAMKIEESRVDEFAEKVEELALTFTVHPPKP